MSAGEPFFALLVVGVLVVTFWFAHPPAPSVAGDVKPDRSTTAYHGVRSEKAPDGTFSLFDDMDRLVAQLHLRHGQLSVVPLRPVTDTDGTKHPYHNAYERDVYGWDTDLDIGTWAGYSSADAAHFQVGIRYAPVRLLADILALDVVASRDVAGAGISLYPPPEYLGDSWSHLGLGVWYVAPYRGGRPGLCYGLSFSTHE